MTGGDDREGSRVDQGPIRSEEHQETDLQGIHEPFVQSNESQTQHLADLVTTPERSVQDAPLVGSNGPHLVVDHDRVEADLARADIDVCQ